MADSDENRPASRIILDECGTNPTDLESFEDRLPSGKRCTLRRWAEPVKRDRKSHADDPAIPSCHESSVETC